MTARTSAALNNDTLIHAMGRFQITESGDVAVANGDEALREIAMDIAEGADSVMVKPGLAYLDVIWRAKETFGVPVYAYQVSGEYALIEAGAAAGIADREALLMEKLIAFKRAGCSGILSYHAPLAARLLNG